MTKGKLDKALLVVSKLILMTIIFLLVFEAVSFGLTKFYKSGRGDSEATSGAYVDSPWAKDYFKEHRASLNVVYSPYIGHRHLPNISGKYINTNEEANRVTLNPCSKEDAIQIFMFGGSTIWGTGARDDFTIPSYVSKILCTHGYNINVTNLGEIAYVNSQEVILLQEELKKGNHPDLVIFYDGGNDVFAAFQHGIPGYSQNYHRRVAEFNSRLRFNILPPLQSIYSVQVIGFLLSKIMPRETKTTIGKGLQVDNIYSKIANVYEQNQRVVFALSKEYDFETLFYLQPIVYNKGNLTNEEIGYIDPVWEDFYANSYEAIRDNPEMVDISHVFGDYNKTVFFDFIHLGEKGNLIVANRISKDILKTFESSAVGRYHNSLE